MLGGGSKVLRKVGQFSVRKNKYVYKNDDNKIMHKWFLESANKLYGAFYENRY